VLTPARIKFAVVREDPDVEHALCLHTKAERVLVVASGGCTALTLKYRVPGVAVTAFDLSDAQLAHVGDKRLAVARGDLRALGVGDDSPESLNQRGEFESLFRTLRRFLEEMVTARGSIARYFHPDTPAVDRRALVEGWRSSRYWPVTFSLAFHDALLNTMFGPAATQHAEPGSYPRYFQRAFERGLLRDDGAANPFLAHVLLGTYLPGHPPDYVHAGRLLDVELVPGQLPDVAGLGRYDLVSLSNVFDWSDDTLVARWGQSLRALRPGAAIVIRQLNNRREVAQLLPGFEWDAALGQDLLSRDRSLFYERILVGFRNDRP
jgi:S-adenosylmethionine-diacylglycerol 3-amino-3-carboxypropyl transferase